MDNLSPASICRTIRFRFKDPAWTSDIRFWIILFLLVRLFGITNPPLEIAHNWRMVTTNMYARNFLEIDNNILLPRVDMAGELTGITAKEFPLYNYLIYLASLVFGWQHWYGRLINLLVSSMGIYYFYLIVRSYFIEKHAFSSSIVLMASLWFAYSRKIMPDTFSISLALAGLYFGFAYLKSGGKMKLILYLLLGTLGVLSKVPSIYVFSVLFIPFFHPRVLLVRKAWFIAASFFLLAVNAIWYLYWVPEVVRTYGFVHYPERGFSEGARQVFENRGTLFKRFYFSALMSYTSFGVFLAGLALALYRKEKMLLGSFLLLCIPFSVFILKAGSSFTMHNYYIIPFVPAMALLTGYFLSAIKRTWVYIALLLIISAEGIGNQQHEFFVPAQEEYKLQLESIADSVSNPGDLIAVSGGHNPQQLYFSHRKGWALNDEEADDPVEVNELRDRGARFLFINKQSLIGEFDQYSLVYEDDHYRVYALE